MLALYQRKIVANVRAVDSVRPRLVHEERMAETEFGEKPMAVSGTEDALMASRGEFRVNK